MSFQRPYPVLCSSPGCTEKAQYKIAAAWTDGTLVELKPYGFTCPKHVKAIYELGKQKRARCRLSPGESMEPVGIFELSPERSDRELVRKPELEDELEREGT